MKKNKINIPKNNNEVALVLLNDIKQLIDESKKQIALNVNVQMSYLYWKIGNKINTIILKGKRADYGSEIVVSLSRQLVMEHGDSFSEKNLRRMMQFATVFQEEEIVVSLIRQLSWTHIKNFLSVNKNINNLEKMKNFDNNKNRLIYADRI